MTDILTRHARGRLQVSLWAGPGEPPDDPALWLDFDEAEAQVAEFAANANPKTGSNPFSEAGARRIWARWNANAVARGKSGAKK